MSTSLNILIGLAVLVLLVWRQMRKRTVNEDRRPLILLILLVLGIVQLSTYFKDTAATTGIVIGLVVSLALGAGMGVLRAYTMRLWREDGQLWRQGTALTVALWLAGVAVHIGVDYLFEGSAKGLGTASILLYLAVTLGLQRLVVQNRANRLVTV